MVYDKNMLVTNMHDEVLAEVKFIFHDPFADI